jgi:hypothetical protein
MSGLACGMAYLPNCRRSVMLNLCARAETAAAL